MVTLDRYDGTRVAAQQQHEAGHRRTTRSCGSTPASTTRSAAGRSARRSRSPRPTRAPGCRPSGSLTSLRFLIVDATPGRSERCATTWPPPRPCCRSAIDSRQRLRVHRDRAAPQASSRRRRPWVGAHASAGRGAERVDPLILPAVLTTHGTADAQGLRPAPRYLRDQGRYSDGAVPASSSTRPATTSIALVDGFLLAPTPVGDDEQYAAAMALLANRVGVPARVVVGAVRPRRRQGPWRGRARLGGAAGGRRAAGGPCPPRTSWEPAAAAAHDPGSPPRGPPPSDAVAQPPDPGPHGHPRSRQADDEGRPRPGARVVPARACSLAARSSCSPLVVPRRPSSPVVAVRRRRGRPSDRMAGAWLELVDHARDLGSPGQGARLETGPGAGAGVPGPAGSSREGRRRRLRRGRALRGRGHRLLGAGDGGAPPAWGRGSACARRLWAPFNPL